VSCAGCSLPAIDGVNKSGSFTPPPPLPPHVRFFFVNAGRVDSFNIRLYKERGGAREANILVLFENLLFLGRTRKTQFSHTEISGLRTSVAEPKPERDS
jgi:hypothetical protein